MIGTMTTRTATLLNVTVTRHGRRVGRYWTAAIVETGEAETVTTKRAALAWARARGATEVLIDHEETEEG